MIAVLLVLLFILSNTQFVNFVNANPTQGYAEIFPPNDAQSPVISISLQNNTMCTSKDISLNIIVSIPEFMVNRYDSYLSEIRYQTDWKENITLLYQHGIYGQFISNFSHTLNLTDIPEGSHYIAFVAETLSYEEETSLRYFTMAKYSKLYFMVDAISPSVSIVSLENIIHETSNIPFNFLIDENVTQIIYSLDNQNNVTLNGNSTLTNLSEGVHNVTVYATDIAGNVGSSETLTFAIDKPEPFPFLPIAVSVVASAVCAFVAVVYVRKRRASCVLGVVKNP